MDYIIVIDTVIVIRSLEKTSEDSDVFTRIREDQIINAYAICRI